MMLSAFGLMSTGMFANNGIVLPKNKKIELNKAPKIVTMQYYIVHCKWGDKRFACDSCTLSQVQAMANALCNG